MKILRLLPAILLAALPALPLRAAMHGSAEGKFTLVIDAGHGGKDAGAIGTYSKEKNINLNVALAFGKLVETNCADVRVVYTRKTDVFIPLEERANIANRSKADLFVSIHTNALPGGRIAYGSETYTLGMARSAENFDVAKRENSVILVESDYKEKYAGFNPNSSESYIIFEFMQDEHMKQSISLAKSIQKYYVSMASRPNKGVHQAGFLVLRETSMPSVLTELGFITTPQEEAYLNSQQGINKLARSIFEGFLDYKHEQDGRTRPSISYPADKAPSEPADSAKTSAPAPAQPQTTKSVAEPSPTRTEYTAAAKPTSVLQRMAGDGGGSKVPTTKKPTPAATNKAADSSPRAKADTDKGKAPAPTAHTAKTNAKTDKDAAKAADKAKSGKVTFRIQFLTSATKLNADDPRLKGFANAEPYQDKPGGLYKYTCCPTTDYATALTRQKEVRKKVKDAFVVAFKGGKRIELSEAIK